MKLKKGKRIQQITVECKKYNHKRAENVKYGDKSGITLVSLAITIIVIVILAGIVTAAGTDSIINSKKTAFITELEMIQEKVETIYEKRKLNEDNIAYYDTLGNDLSLVEQSKLNLLLDGKEETGYRYFSKDDLKQLDLDNMNQNVIINFQTRDVASISGFEIENVVCYRITDIPGYRVNNIEYTNHNTVAPTFDLEVTTLSDSWLITAKNIVYNSNVATGTLSYKMQGNTEWIIVGKNNFFEVSKSGLYDIKLEDSAGNEKIVENLLIGTEVYKDDFEKFEYTMNNTQVNSCENSILSVTSTYADPMINMYNVTSFKPYECRYIEIKYRTKDNDRIQLFMIENPKNETYGISVYGLIKDGQWHTVVFDLWSNENVKNREEITGWRLDWGANKAEISMEIDYIRVVK